MYLTLPRYVEYKYYLNGRSCIIYILYNLINLSINLCLCMNFTLP